MADRYPHFWGGSQICTQGAPPVKATNGEKLKMLNCKFAFISDPAVNTMQTPVYGYVTFFTNHMVVSRFLLILWLCHVFY